MNTKNKIKNGMNNLLAVKGIQGYSPSNDKLNLYIKNCGSIAKAAKED